MPNLDNVPRVVKNETFYLFARVCMIVCLPVLGFMIQRVITQADAITLQVQQQNTTLQLLTASMQERFSSLSDHESRLRRLERK